MQHERIFNFVQGKEYLWDRAQCGAPRGAWVHFPAIYLFIYLQTIGIPGEGRREESNNSGVTNINRSIPIIFAPWNLGPAQTPCGLHAVTFFDVSILKTTQSKNLFCEKKKRKQNSMPWEFGIFYMIMYIWEFRFHRRMVGFKPIQCGF